MTKIYYLKVTEIGNNSYETIKNYVSINEIKKINLYKNSQEAKLSLLGKVLLRYLLCNKLSLSNEALLFEKNYFGKEFLINDSHTHFNVSHSNEYVIIAIDSSPVGVDIERVKIIDITKFKHILTDSEYHNITCTKKIEEQNKLFFKYWILKESFLKFIGTGLYIHPNTVSFDMNSDFSKITFNINYHPNLTFDFINLDSRYETVVCHKSKLDKVEKIEPFDLLNFFSSKKYYED